MIHAGMSPLDILSATDILLSNPIEDNVGNLLFQNSVFRTFVDNDVQIDPDFYNFDSSKSRAEEINSKYDYYLLPLANYFRESYVPYLRKQTELIKQLRIPVVVIGVGLQAPTNQKIENGFSFDDDVKDFVRAVLDRSAMLGLRGETTARYLKFLGFKEEKDYTVIGCPSMYTFGRNLEIREATITKNSNVSVNSARKRINDRTAEYLERSTKAFANHNFIPQDIDELKLVYTGHGSIKYKSNYSNYMTDEIYKSSHVRFPLNVATWFAFLKDSDLVFGARIHGNIVSTLAGTPSVLFPIDTRTLELAKYHDLNYIRINKANEQTPLLDLLKGVDFQKPIKKHVRNFDHYIDFLDKNNLDHIYKNNRNRKDAPYDELVATISYPGMVTAANTCSPAEHIERLNLYYPQLENQMQKELKRTRKRVVKYQEKLEETRSRLKLANKAIDNRDVVLNRKVVRLALKLAGMLRG